MNHYNILFKISNPSNDAELINLVELNNHVHNTVNFFKDIIVRDLIVNDNNIVINNIIYYKNKQNFICGVSGPLSNVMEYNDLVVLKDGTFIVNIDVEIPCNIYYEIKIVTNKPLESLCVGWLTHGTKSKDWVFREKMVKHLLMTNMMMN